jgi:aspartate-semialdehyde dehydrogenase
MRLAVVGATGVVGAEMLSILETAHFPIAGLVPVASHRSAGRRLTFRGAPVEVRTLDPEVFDDVDVALFDVPDDVARKWAPVAVARGATVVDNSAAWRMDPDVPLVVPEVNPQACDDAPNGIIASPNCTMLAFVVPLGALHEHARLTKVVFASFQAASGAGRGGVEELWEQIERASKEADAVIGGRARDVLHAGAVFPHPLALNVIPQVGSVRDNGHTGEELKVGAETRKVLGLPELPVTGTCVRVPTVRGHAVSVHAEFRSPLSVDDARGILEATRGIEVRDDVANGVYPTPLEAAGRDPCYVGRIRNDPYDPKALELFCVADNLRKGAALNAVQIVEALTASRG